MWKKYYGSTHVQWFLMTEIWAMKIGKATNCGVFCGKLTSKAGTNYLCKVWDPRGSLKCTTPLDIIFHWAQCVNTLRPRQDGHHLPDGIFVCIFFNENAWIFIKILLKFVPKGPVNSIPALVQIITWHRPGNKPLSEPMMVSLLTHICVTWPQWVKGNYSQMGYPVDNRGGGYKGNFLR